MVGIVGWGCYIPRFRIKVEDIAKVWNADSDKIKSGLQITEKSVPGMNEDTASISVQAARKAVNVASIEPKSIGAVYIGSESHPYAVKPTGTIVGEAVGIGNNYTTADFEFACKAGTAAMQVALAFVGSGMAEYVLAGGADTAQASPGDPLEYTAAAGGAMFIIGKDKVSVEVNHTLSYTSDTPDFWRRAGQKYPSHGGAFTGEPAYFRHIKNATKMMFERSNSDPSDYRHVIFHQPNGKFPTRVAKSLGFEEEQYITGLLVGRIGNTYSGSSPLGLAAVLDVAYPGDKILLVSYGSGAGSDCFDMTVTDEIKNAQKRSCKVGAYIEDKEYIDYSQYLRNIGKL